MKKLFFLGLMIMGKIQSAESLENFSVTYDSYGKFMKRCGEETPIKGNIKTLRGCIEQVNSHKKKLHGEWLKTTNVLMEDQYEEDKRNYGIYCMYLKNKLFEAERDYYKALSIKFEQELNITKRRLQEAQTRLAAYESGANEE